MTDRSTFENFDLERARRLCPPTHCVVPIEMVEDAAADAALRVTASWLDIKGSGLTIRREKMKRRFAAAVSFYQKQQQAEAMRRVVYGHGELTTTTKEGT